MIERDAAIRDALLCASEESFLWELSQRLQARFPEATVSECDATARESASALLTRGWAQLASTKWAALSSGTVLSLAEALEALREPCNWCIPPSNQDTCFQLLLTEPGRQQPF